MRRRFQVRSQRDNRQAPRRGEPNRQKPGGSERLNTQATKPSMALVGVIGRARSPRSTGPTKTVLVWLC